jgi:hypothetical protein
VLISSSRGPPVWPLIASTALMIRFSNTCWSCTRSPSMSGKLSVSSVEEVRQALALRQPHPQAVRLGRVEGLEQVAFLDEIPDPTESPARLPSLAMLDH